MNKLTLKQLRYFESLARHGHFGRAAEACAISQPALSMQIREMEETLGTALFERGARQARLTGFGEDVSSRIRNILQAVDELETLSRASGSGLTGRLRQSFGLDDLDVTTGEEGGTAVRLGKYISRNIYADVVLGSGGTSAVNLNLDLTPDLKARGSATAEGETSLGVFFERDY